MADQNTSRDSSNVHLVEQGDVSLHNNIHNSANSPRGTQFMPFNSIPGPGTSVVSTSPAGNLMNGAVFYQNTPIVNNPLSNPPWVDQLFARLAATEQRVSNMDKIVSNLEICLFECQIWRKQLAILGIPLEPSETSGHLDLLKGKTKNLALIDRFKKSYTFV